MADSKDTLSQDISTRLQNLSSYSDLSGSEDSNDTSDSDAIVAKTSATDSTNNCSGTVSTGFSSDTEDSFQESPKPSSSTCPIAPCSNRKSSIHQTSLLVPIVSHPRGNNGLFVGNAVGYRISYVSPQPLRGGLPPFKVAEAVGFFRPFLLLEDFKPTGPLCLSMAAAACAAHYVYLVSSWRPYRRDFWLLVLEFNQAWAPNQHVDGFRRSRMRLPVCRPLCAGRISNNLFHLWEGACNSKLLPEGLSPEVRAVMTRFGIRESDVRVTSQSLFNFFKGWTGLDWRKAFAADPCPWPVPGGLNGLNCCWAKLASAIESTRVYVNPPWSQLQGWLVKASLECKKGLQVLAVMPLWQKNLLSTLKEDPGLRLDFNVVWDAEFIHPTSSCRMPPLDVLVVWMRPTETKSTSNT